MQSNLEREVDLGGGGGGKKMNKKSRQVVLLNSIKSY
jgi:hypothetical protein